MIRPCPDATGPVPTSHHSTRAAPGTSSTLCRERGPFVECFKAARQTRIRDNRGVARLRFSSRDGTGSRRIPYSI